MRVLIVDDHAAFRAVARTLLERIGHEVVGEAADGEEALAASVRLQPDLVLLDIGLPLLDGFGVAERLAVQPVPPAVVFVSSRAEGSYRRRLATATARGFIAKDALTGPALTALLP